MTQPKRASAMKKFFKRSNADDNDDSKSKSKLA